MEEWAEESKENRKLLEQVYCTAALIRRVCTYDAAYEEKALAQFRRDLAFKRRFGAANQIDFTITISADDATATDGIRKYFQA